MTTPFAAEALPVTVSPAVKAPDRFAIVSVGIEGAVAIAVDSYTALNLYASAYVIPIS